MNSNDLTSIRAFFAKKLNLKLRLNMRFKELENILQKLSKLNANIFIQRWNSYI
jgi:hypothetical protein